MFISPYSTTPCSSYNLEKIVLEIKKALIDGRLNMSAYLDEDLQVGSVRSDVYAVTGKEDSIPPFAHPLVVEEKDRTYIVLDLRPSTRLDRTGNVIPSSKSDLNFLLLRASLTKAWINLDPIDLLSAGNLPLTVYMRWLSENISRRMGLDAAGQLDVTVVTGYFYLSQFREVSKLDSNEKIKMATQIARASYISAEKCIEIVETLGPMENVNDYVAALIDTVDSVRMRKFNVGLLYSIIAGGWFGANAKETLAVAIEHPPTFIALVYAALTDRSYHRSLFAKIVQQADKNNAGKNFAYNLVRLPEA